MKRFILVLATVVCLSGVVPAYHSASAKDPWISVRSKNFFLVGNASEKEVRQVAVRLEQFREVFSRLLPRMKFTSPVPTTVIVFKSDSSYKPFKPMADGKVVEVAGYFQSGRAANYITLTTEKQPENPYATIFHEYVHLLLNNSLGKTSVPPWFNEGLAEFYSTFDIEDGRKVYLGNLVSYHLGLLRSAQLSPLEKLFSVNYHSLERSKHNSRGLFYAQSWALIHYLMQGNDGKRRNQLAVFLSLLRKNTAVEKAFREAFQTDYAGMQRELKDYTQRRSYSGQIFTFDKKLEFDSEMKSASLSEAEALAYLGDLLYHINRLNDAKTKLHQALKLDPNLAMAHASLGMVFVEQKKFAEAKEELKAAVAGDSTNYLAHYYYAYALSREHMTEGQTVGGFPADTVATMRAQLHRAIDLKPDFPESYHLLAFVNLVTGEQLDESIGMIKRAVALSPGSEEFLFVLAQLYMRKQDFEEAQKVVEPLAATGADPRIRANAQSLLASILSIQEAKARFESGKEEGLTNSPVLSVTVTGDAATEKIDPSSYLRDALRKPGAGETQVEGSLLRIECTAKSIIFVVKVGERLIRLRTESFENVTITTFSPDIGGEITCGPRKPENTVVVCYQPANDAKAKTNGRVRSVEFVPQDFKLKG